MDDEIISMGISVMRNAPDSHLVVITNGGPLYGEEFFLNKGYVSREHYMLVREAETKISGITLGVPSSNIKFLGVNDQETQNHIPFIVDSLVMYAHEHKIKTIHSLCYEGNHPDHDVVRFCAWFVANAVGAELIEYSNNLVRKRKYEIPFIGDFKVVKPTAEEKALKRKILGMVYKSQNINLDRYKTREYRRPVLSNDYSILRTAKRLRFEKISLIKPTRKNLFDAFQRFENSRL